MIRILLGSEKRPRIWDESIATDAGSPRSRAIRCAAAVGLVMLAACGKPADDSAPPAHDAAAADSPSVGQLVQSGDREACSHPDVQRLILERVQPGTSKAQGTSVDLSEEDLTVAQEALPPSTLSNFQAIAWQKNAGTMRCQVEIASPFHSAQRRYQFTLKGLPKPGGGLVLDGNFKMAQAVATAELEGMARDLANARGPQLAEMNAGNTAAEPAAANLSADDQSAIDAAMRNSDLAREALARGAPGNVESDREWERPSIDDER